MHDLHGILNIEGGCCLHILYEVLWMKQCTWCNCQTEWLGILFRASAPQEATGRGKRHGFAPICAKFTDLAIVSHFFMHPKKATPWVFILIQRPYLVHHEKCLIIWFIMCQSSLHVQLSYVVPGNRSTWSTGKSCQWHWSTMLGVGQLSMRCMKFFSFWAGPQARPWSCPLRCTSS